MMYIVKLRKMKRKNKNKIKIEVTDIITEKKKKSKKRKFENLDNFERKKMRVDDKKKKESITGNAELLIPTSLVEQLKTSFNETMKNINVSLLNDFSSYLKSLPVRFYLGKYMQLFNLSYCVRRKDLTDMAIAITKPEDARSEVRYISSPSRSGKTASVLPAFLHSRVLENGGTHYFYIAFHNNDERHFTCTPYSPSKDTKIAQKQGAAFIFECVKILLEQPDNHESYEINLEELPKVSMEKSLKALIKYLTDKLGEGCRIWFHVDEHGKMCDRSPDGDGDGAAFSRGALETLAQVKGAKVIATYTERPKYIPAPESSQVCRVPIALPPVDINQVMTTIKELSIDSSHFSLEDKRMFASLKVRLGFKLKEMDIISVLHERGSKPATEEFLDNFVKAKNYQKPLQQCNALCSFAFLTDDGDYTFDIIDDIAAKLLLGIKDTDKTNRQFTDVVSLPGNLITVTIERLLQTVDPEVKVYNIGADLFRKTLTSADLLSNSPLEAAYYWTLSCRSALKNKIIFNDKINFSIKCKDLKPGRIFPEIDNSIYDLCFMKQNTIYYANERNNGIPTHPLADLFFISNNNELVLIDITSCSNKSMVCQLEKKLFLWIIREQVKIEKYSLRGIVLAPNVEDKKDTNETDIVSLISGESAMKLLGGLRQIAQWSEEV